MTCHIKTTIKCKSSLVILALILLLISGCTNKNTQKQNNKKKREQQTNYSAKVDRLTQIKQRGKLICGVNNQIPGFSYKEKDGSYSGLSVDLCRAIAVAIFNDPTKVEFQHLNSEERFAAVKSGKVDILSRNTTWTLTRDTAAGLDFPPTNFYDGQGLLVRTNAEIEKIADLNGKSICAPVNTTSETNLIIQMRKRDIAYSPVLFEDSDQMYAAYESGSCDAATSDRSELVARRLTLSDPNVHKILPEVISKEPLGPVVANGEPNWFDVVEWVSYATIKAEELGINSQNIERFNNSPDPQVRRFLGMEEDLGQNIGLAPDFARRIIQQIGNYGEIYERNIGQPFDLERGINNLVQNGGLLYSPPFK